MMGRLERDQGQFFYRYNLDELVPGVQARCDAGIELAA